MVPAQFLSNSLRNSRKRDYKDRPISQLIMQRNADGHLELFCPGNSAFCNRWQESPIVANVRACQKMLMPTIEDHPMCREEKSDAKSLRCYRSQQYRPAE